MSKMTFDIVKIGEQHKDCFVPMKGHLSNFQNFGMYMAYPTLFKQCWPTCMDNDEISDYCVWDGVYMYNTEYQILPEGCEGDSSRLWLTENGILMLEVYYDGNRPNDLFRCD